MKNKHSKFSIIFIFAFFAFFSETCLAFQAIGDIATSPYQKNESFLTGQLIKLTDTEVRTTVGNFPIQASVVINDSRKKTEKKQPASDVQLTFKNDQLIKLSIY